MTPMVNDRWRAELRVEQLGFYFFTFARLVRIPLRGVLELIG